MRRFVIPVVALLLLLSAVPVTGAQPVKEYLTPSDAVFAAREVCPFAIRLHPEEFDAKTISFVRRDDRFRVIESGRIVMRSTNLKTGASVVRNSSGPAKYSINAAGHLVLSLGGSSVLPFFAEDVTGAGLLYITGKAEFELDADQRFFIRADLPGNVENLCDTLG
jgi:hypothetical protein